VADSYTRKNLAEVDDSAPRFGIGDVQEARFANEDLHAEHIGVSYIRVKPGRKQAFAHKHENAEEVYVVLKGSGRIKIDDEILELEPLDAVRLAPEAVRMMEAGSGGLEILAFGPRHKGDGELLQDWWRD
jgi:mannose-6-phosphate isomerase-like protein (cupin superfamily)